jgi:hypothetical protein
MEILKSLTLFHPVVLIMHKPYAVFKLKNIFVVLINDDKLISTKNYLGNCILANLNKFK